MADRTEHVRYVLEVDDSGIPDELNPQRKRLPGPSGSRGNGRGGGYGGGGSTVSVRRLDSVNEITNIFARVMRAPSFPAMLAQSATLFINRPAVARERAQQAAQAKRDSGLDYSLRKLVPIIANLGQMVMGGRGIYAGSRQLLGSALMANGAGVIRGGIGIAGGVGHLGAGGLGLAIGGPAGMATGATLGLVVGTVTRAMTALVDVTDRVSDSFGKYDARIAAANASVTVAQVQASLRMAQATEPVILAFDKLKVSALAAASSLVAGIANRFGSVAEGLFSRIDDWIQKVAAHFGVDLSAGPRSLSTASLAKGFSAAGAVPAVLTAGEIYRSRLGGTLFGGNIDTRGADNLTNRLLNQREHVRALEAQAAQGDLSPSQTEYVQRQKNYLANLEKQYTRMRETQNRRFPGQGRPIAGAPPRVKHQEGDIPQKTRADRIIELQKEIASITADLNKSSDDPFWRDPTNNRPLDMSGIQAKRAALSQRMNAARTELFKLQQRATSSYVPNPAVAAHEAALRKAQAAHAVAQRELDALESINPARRGMETREKIEQLRNTVRDLNRTERNENAEIQYWQNKARHQVSTGPVAPFAPIDIRQLVNVRMDMKIQSEKEVHEALADVKRELMGGLNTARNEARLAVASTFWEQSSVL